MVPAVVVMGASAFAITFVPNALNRRLMVFGLTPVHLLNQCASILLQNRILSGAICNAL